jgi:hypothetical protein
MPRSMPMAMAWNPGDPQIGGIIIEKNGLGIWKLGGESKFESQLYGKINFTVNEGTLYLYQAEEASNNNSKANAMVETAKINLEGSGSTFTLAEGAIIGLTIRKTDEWNKITADTIIFEDNSSMQVFYNINNYIPKHDDLSKPYHLLELDAASAASLKNDDPNVINAVGDVTIGFLTYKATAAWGAPENGKQYFSLNFLEREAPIYDPDAGGGYAIDVTLAIILNNDTTNVIWQRMNSKENKVLMADEYQKGRYLWGMPFYKFSQTDGWKEGANNFAGYKVKTPGVAVGYEWDTTERHYMGIALTSSYPKYYSGNVTADSNYYRATLYGSVGLNKDWKLGYQLGYGWGDVRQRRTFIGDQYKADYDYKTFNAGVDISKQIYRKDDKLMTSYINYEYINLDTDGSTERGLGNAHLNYGSHGNDLHIMKLGVDYIKGKKDGNHFTSGVFWMGLFGDTQSRTIIYLLDDPTKPYMGYGVKHNRDSIGVKLGYHWEVGSNSSIALNYIGAYGDNLKAHHYGLTFAKKF